MSSSPSPPPAPLKPWAAVAIELLHGCLSGLRLAPALVDHLKQAAPEQLPMLRRRHIDSLYYIGCSVDAAPQRVYDLAWSRQREALVEAVKELTRRGVQVVIWKGAELVSRSYGSRAIGGMSDVDLLVPRAAVGEVKRGLNAVGFRQADMDDDTLELVDFDLDVIAREELGHYELAMFSRAEPITVSPEEQAFIVDRGKSPLWGKSDQTRVSVRLDVHHQVSNDVPSQALLARAVDSSLGVGQTLCPADHLWVLIARYYNDVAFNGKRTLRDFAYLLPLVASPIAVDWELVIAANRQYRLGAALYYYLAFLRYLGAPIPQTALTALLPSPTMNVDLGWQLSGLLETQDPFPLPPTAW